MKRLTLIFLSLVILCGMAKAQDNDPVILTVAGDQVTRSEFLAVYKKNNIKGEVMDRKSLQDYMELYINFKLKVKEAEQMKLDTFNTFKTELAGYRKQLAQPYLTDKRVDSSLLLQAYDRMQWDIRASHILIKVDKNADPADTLEAYRKILKIRERIMKGEPFEKVARETSEDPSARDREDPGSKTMIRGNGGDLGYFTVLDMIYPFETGAYTTNVGEVSMPVRTDYGYHLIKVTKRQPAMGKVVVAHIYVNVPRDAKPEDLATYREKIEEAYAKLRDGGNFDEVVKEYSEDKGSASKGGVLPGFGVNRMVPEFIEAIEGLKNPGDYSAPVKTDYGWHIIRLVEQKPVKSFEEEKVQLKARILKDSRSNMSRESMISRIRKEYGFQEFRENVRDFYKVVDTTIFEGKWDAAKAGALQKPLFVLDKETYTQKDFASYLAAKQTKRPYMNIHSFVNEKYDSWVNDKCIALEDSKLEQKHPDFKALMKEYRDGILLFELTDKKVWSKAIQDTTGLKAFYELNKNNYLWDQRLDASIYTCKDAAVAATARKLAKNVLKGKMSETDLLAKINADSVSVLSIEHKLYLRGDNKTIDSVAWVKGITDNKPLKDKVVFVVVHSVIEPQPKTLKEARGLITADYQNFLEKAWIAELRQKYPFSVNQDVFEGLLK